MTDTNDIVEPAEAIAWLLNNADRFHKFFNLHPEVKTAYELANLIEQQDKDITAMVKQIALQETKINEQDKVINEDGRRIAADGRRIAELEAAIKVFERLPNRIEKIAFGIAPPNRHTPELVSLAGEVRIELAALEDKE